MNKVSASLTDIWQGAVAVSRESEPLLSDASGKDRRYWPSASWIRGLFRVQIRHLDAEPSSTRTSLCALGNEADIRGLHSTQDTQRAFRHRNIAVSQPGGAHNS